MGNVPDQEHIQLTDAEWLVRQSDEQVARFDPQRITDALVRETKLAPELAQQIALEVQEQIQRSGIRALTAPLIRGLVDARLLEHGLLVEHRRHSRLGVPLYDVDKLIQSVPSEPTALYGPEGTSLALAQAIKREYAMLAVFSEAVANAHLAGDLYLENLGEIDRPTTMMGSIDFIKRQGVRLPGGFAGSRPARYPSVLVSHLVTYTAALQGYFSEALAWDSVNFAFAPMLVGLGQREIRQVAQGLLFELSAPAIARGGQPVQCDLHLDWDAPAYLRDLPAVGVGGDKLGDSYGKMSTVARELLKALFEVYLEGDGQGFHFTGPRLILHLTHSVLENSDNRAFLDLVSRVAAERGGVVLAFDRTQTGDGEDAGESFRARYGVGAEKLQRAPESWQWRTAMFSSVAINLPRVGYQAEGDRQLLFDLLTQLLELAAQASLEKRIFLEKLLARGEAGALAMLAMRPDKEPFLPLSWTAHAICPIGLAELAQVVTGASLVDSPDALAFAQQVVKHLNTEAERLSAKHKVRFVLAESHDLIAPQRLARLDVERYGTDALRVFPRQDGATENPQDVFYTGSVKLPVTSTVDAVEKARLEGALQSGTFWGAATDIWLGGSLPQPAQIAELITRTFRETQTAAISFAPEFTLCQACHTLTRGLQSSCWHCGAARVDNLAQAANRYSRTSTWPRWKLTELQMRNRALL